MVTTPSKRACPEGFPSSNPLFLALPSARRTYSTQTPCRLPFPSPTEREFDCRNHKFSTPTLPPSIPSALSSAVLAFLLHTSRANIIPPPSTHSPGADRRDEGQGRPDKSHRPNIPPGQTRRQNQTCRTARLFAKIAGPGHVIDRQPGHLGFLNRSLTTPKASARHSRLFKLISLIKNDYKIIFDHSSTTKKAAEQKKSAAAQRVMCARSSRCGWAGQFSHFRTRPVKGWRHHSIA